MQTEGLRVHASPNQMERKMLTYFPRLVGLVATAVAVPALILTSACTPPASAPEQTSASNPTVTYTYTGDQELIKANQQAMMFCDPYHGTPRAVSVTGTSNGSKSAVFECLKTPPPTVVLAPASSYLTASYQTDQEFLDASRNAHLYCLGSGMRGLTASITPNYGGSSTVAFQCSPV